MRSTLGSGTFACVVALLLGGCGPSPQEPDCAIGAYDGELVPFLEGDEVELVSGIQGGFHVELALLGVHLDPDDALLSVGGAFADTGQTVAIPLTRILSSAEVTAEFEGWVHPDERLIMATSDPTDVVGHDLRVSATIEDASGATAACSVVVHIVDMVDELALPPVP